LNLTPENTEVKISTWSYCFFYSKRWSLPDNVQIWCTYN